MTDSSSVQYTLAQVFYQIGAVTWIVGYVPQLTQAYKTKSTGDLAAWTQMLLITSQVFIVGFGFAWRDWLIVLVNAAQLFLMTWTLILIYKFKKEA
jgi:hypothetical protein